MDDLNFIVLQSTKELGRLSTIVPEFFFVFCSSFFSYLIFLAEIKIHAVYHYLLDSKFSRYFYTENTSSSLFMYVDDHLGQNDHKLPNVSTCGKCKQCGIQFLLFFFK